MNRCVIYTQVFFRESRNPMKRSTPSPSPGVTQRAWNSTIKDLLDHIDYAVDLVGADHVGIGTDQGWAAPTPREDILALNYFQGRLIFPELRPRFKTPF